VGGGGKIVKVVVLGGGYAGMSCLMELARRLPRARRTLVDPDRSHLKVTRLHEALSHPLARFQVPFEKLADRYGFEHRRERVVAGRRNLVRWAERRCVPLSSGDLPFDLLVVAVGARPRPRPAQPGFQGLGDLRRREGRRLVEVMAAGRTGSWVTVAGGGATGLQYLFELRDALRRAGGRCRLRLVDAADRLLPAQPAGFHAYLSQRLDGVGIRYLRRTRLVGGSPGRILLSGPQGQERELPSAHTLVFAGLRGNPALLETNSAGQVVLDGRVLETVFAAGDCSHYAGGGFNGQSAQAAVRKGRHVAACAERISKGLAPVAYDAQELGFFLSMGALDGVGWAGTRRNVVTGLPAYAIREAIEARYELFLAGIDTFQVF
jgi:NADH dehydrogenase